ncbi:MAG TPA: AI-2E family transporter [Candidatus Competibacteraceae bacterium]|nr:AI-2E family transporter [Candidatus Competibacteraceae bacterium]
MNTTSLDTARLIQRVLLILGLTTLFVAVFLALWYLPDVFLILLAGILLTVFFDGLADVLVRHTDLSGGSALTWVLLAFFLLSLGVLWLLGPVLSDGFQQLGQGIWSGATHLENWLKQYDLGQNLLQGLQDNLLTPARLQRLIGIFSTALGTLTTLFFILILGIYLCLEPETYIKGTLRLFPPANRAHAHALLRELGQTLRWWLVGRIASMLVVGVLTGLGLLLVGIPSALALAVLAALLTFIPNLGPILSALPAVLLGLAQSHWLALSVALLYLIVQTVESYFITPLIQRRVVAMPPALLLAVQLLLGVTVGMLGLLMSGPLTVIVMGVVQRLYLEDLLEAPAAKS